MDHLADGCLRYKYARSKERANKRQGILCGLGGEGQDMKHRWKKWLWTAVVIAGAVALWRAAMVAGAAAPFSFAHADRLVFALIVAAGVVAFTVVMARLQSRPITFAPLDQRTVTQTGIGFMGYSALALVVVGIMMLAGLVGIKLTAAPDAALWLLYLLLLVFLSEALPEELLFRGWLMEVFGVSRSPWIAILGQAAVFTLFAWALGGLASFDDASFIACFGVVLGIVRVVTGTIWASVGVHLAFIAAQQSALPQWTIWSGDPHMMVQVAGLAIIPFSIIVAVLFGRVKPSLNPSPPT